MGCITVETIKHIKDTQIDQNGNPRDIISEALAKWNSYGLYTQAVHDRIWQEYEYRMIGSCDVERWIGAFGNYLATIAEVYVGRLSMQASVTPDVGGLITRTYGERTDKGVSEDMPDTASPDTDPYTYPSARNSMIKGTQTDTEHDSGSSAEHLSEYYKNLKDPLDDMMRDISKYWLNLWC